MTRVSGKLKPKDREVLADNIGKVVIGYFEDAFTGGEYPRSSFGDAFATFSQGAARQADADERPRRQEQRPDVDDLPARPARRRGGLRRFGPGLHGAGR